MSLHAWHLGYLNHTESCSLPLFSEVLVFILANVLKHIIIIHSRYRPVISGVPLGTMFLHFSLLQSHLSHPAADVNQKSRQRLFLVMAVLISSSVFNQICLQQVSLVLYGSLLSHLSFYERLLRFLKNSSIVNVLRLNWFVINKPTVISRSMKSLFPFHL